MLHAYKTHPEFILTSYCKRVLSKANTSKEMACGLRVVIVLTCVLISSAKSLFNDVSNLDNRLINISAHILESMEHYLAIRPSFDENKQRYDKIINLFALTQKSDNLENTNLRNKSEDENGDLILPVNFTTYSEKQDLKKSRALQDSDETIKIEEGKITYYSIISRSAKSNSSTEVFPLSKITITISSQ